MTTFEEKLFAYIAAWSEPDESLRRERLATCWAEHALYIDPTGEALGHDALVRHIGRFLRRFPDHRFLLTSGLTLQRGGWFRFTWTLLKPDGERSIEGVDFGRVGPDGYLLSVTGFFGPPSPAPANWPEELVYREPLATQG